MQTPEHTPGLRLPQNGFSPVLLLAALVFFLGSCSRRAMVQLAPVPVQTAQSLERTTASAGDQTASAETPAKENIHATAQAAPFTQASALPQAPKSQARWKNNRLLRTAPARLASRLAPVANVLKAQRTLAQATARKLRTSEGDNNFLRCCAGCLLIIVVLFVLGLIGDAFATYGIGSGIALLVLIAIIVLGIAALAYLIRNPDSRINRNRSAGSTNEIDDLDD